MKVNMQTHTMGPHSSTLAWRIPWTEELGGLQSMGSQRVGHDWATSLWLFAFMHREGNGNPLQYSCLESPRDGGAWWAAVYGVTRSQTWLKRLSSNSSSIRQNGCVLYSVKSKTCTNYKIMFRLSNILIILKDHCYIKWKENDSLQRIIKFRY